MRPPLPNPTPSDAGKVINTEAKLETRAHARGSNEEEGDFSDEFDDADTLTQTEEMWAPGQWRHKFYTLPEARSGHMQISLTLPNFVDYFSCFLYLTRQLLWNYVDFHGLSIAGPGELITVIT